MEEVWKPISCLASGHEVSTHGRVRDRDGRFLAIHPAPRQGYMRVKIYVEGRSRTYNVHRLVAIAFLPNPERKPVVNHQDLDKGNNRVGNLEWATHAENAQHWAKATGRRHHSHPKSKLSPDAVAEIRVLKREGGLHLPSLAAKFGCSTHAIWSAAHERSYRTSDAPIHPIGRATGSRVGTAKLSEQGVREIKVLIRDHPDMTLTEIAAKFSVSRANIGFIKSGRAWKHVVVGNG